MSDITTNTDYLVTPDHNQYYLSVNKAIKALQHLQDGLSSGEEHLFRSHNTSLTLIMCFYLYYLMLC